MGVLKRSTQKQKTKGEEKMFIDKEALLEALEEKYGDLTDECGCSVFNGEDYEWLSVADIVAIINSCIEYD